MRHLKTFAIIVACCAAALPLAFAASIMTVPLLRIIEERWGIESIGHSGPAEWVIWTIWGVLSLIIAGSILRMGKKRDKAE